MAILHLTKELYLKNKGAILLLFGTVNPAAEGMYERIGSVISNPNHKLLALSEDSIIACCLFDREQGRISFLFSHPEIEAAEIQMFDAVFEDLKKSPGRIIWESDISPNLDAHMRKLGFEVLERANMKLTSDKIELLPEVGHDPQYSTTGFDSAAIDEIAMIVHLSSKDSIDAEIYPFFKTHEGCIGFVNDFVNGKYGNFNPILTRVLYHDNAVIGYCLTASHKDEMAFIADLGVRSDYRGKGMGKAIFIDALKTAKHIMPDLKSVVGTVTRDNIVAVTMYEKLYFELENGKNAYIWIDRT